MEIQKISNPQEMTAEKSELSIVENTCKLLSLHGDSQVVYVTAELAPFSNQQKPDLVYTPSKYNSHIVYFIEYKKTPLKGYSNNFFSDLMENKSFAEESLQQKVVYVFSTNKKFNPELNLTTHEKSIVILDQIEDEHDLYNAIINLTK